MKTKLSRQSKEILAVFSEPKLLILRELFYCSEDICGCDLVEKIGISKDLLSYHIKTLRSTDYISEIKCGRNKKYVITKNKEKLVEKILDLLQMKGEK